jgi:hypothetical protein
MSWKDLERGDKVNRPSDLPPVKMALAHTENANQSETYNNMKVTGVDISGETIKDGLGYHTKGQVIDEDSSYLVLEDLRTRLVIPVREDRVEEMWSEFLFKVKGT